MGTDLRSDAVGAIPRRLFAYNGGFLSARLRKILRAAGHDLRLGLPGAQDAVVVWGHSPTAWRGEAIAAGRNVPLVRVEDAFLRSVHPGRAGAPPMGVIIDPHGVYYDSSAPSAIERILATDSLADNELLQRSDAGLARLIASDLSKYNNFAVDAELPEPPYVLVVDQTHGDASIRFGGASAAAFDTMLAAAVRENPGKRIVIKSHPETALGLRKGHFGAEHVRPHIQLVVASLSPWKLLAGATAVYTVSSQLGYEAILAGRRPRVFGQPFYAGWGLSDDAMPLPRRTRTLTRTQMFAATHLIAPIWYDPCRDRQCSFEQALDQLEVEARAFREDRKGYVAVGIRLWKRPTLQSFFGREKRVLFDDNPTRAIAKARKSGRGLLVWAGRETAELRDCGLPLARIEDGFLRSRGLGAELVPPLSLVRDSTGIYYDPTRPSDLETFIATPAPDGGRRSQALVASLRTLRLSKYNLATADTPDMPPGHRILVPGQVEDDASIKLGASATSTNLALLAKVRAINQAKVVIFKPHPDVEAGLRIGRVSPQQIEGLATVIASFADPISLIDSCDEIYTIASLLGFEALLRAKPVTCLGMPFYAGWGLTTDLAPAPSRRTARPDLLQLAHAVLIAYPRYFDPVSRLPCPPEVVVERLATGTVPHPGPVNRILAKLQGLFASWPVWR